MIKCLKARKSLIALVLLFLFTRFILIYASPYTYDVDGCIIGDTANEILDGLKQPYDKYEYQNNYGNTLVTPLLVAPLFLIFGKTSFAILLAGMLIALGMLIVLYLFAEKFLNKKIACYASLFFILSPSSYTIPALFVGHGHLHVTFFIMLSMIFFFNYYFNVQNKTRNIILFGLSSGLGIFFSNIFLFILPPCFMLWFLKDKIFFLKKEFLIFVLALSIALIPWIYVNMQTDFRGLSLFKSGFDNNFANVERLGEISQKAIDTFSYHLPKSLNFTDTIFKKDLLNYTYYAILLISLFYLLYRNYPYLIQLLSKKSAPIPKENIVQMFIVITTLFFLFIFIMSNFSVDGAVHSRQYRYLSSIFPFFFIILAIAIFEISKHKKMLSIGLLVLLIILGLITNLGLISLSSELGFEKNTNPRPICYEMLGFIFGSRNSDNPQLAFEECNKLRQEHRQECYKWVSIGATDRIGYNPEQIIKVCSTLNEFYRPNCYLGAGWVIGIQDFFHKGESIVDEDCGKFEEKYKPDCYKGAGWLFGWNYGYYPEQGGAECEKLNPQYKQFCYEWLGYVIGEVRGDITNGINDCKKFKEFSSICCRGLLEFTQKEVLNLPQSQDYCQDVARMGSGRG
ncbi:glycosyltransferase family 39 protein [Candidatus Woesearchaeota archaeon]|nr:glycosyltransferase family 39 protein [Candidatus Woesearchaeota archaeon]